MAFIARRLVSTNKRRYQDDGFDLDLTYITPRVIAMGFPCDDFVSSMYRNPADQVVKLLESRHPGRYKVYNLCVERGYDAAMFGGRVMRLPMHDGQAPPLSLMLEMCRDATAWLAADEANVVAVHCKAGKGRTGAAVCALLLALEPRVTPSSLDDTLSFWAKQRTKDSKGLTIPSQRRFLAHVHAVLLDASTDTTSAATASGAASNGHPHVAAEPSVATAPAAAAQVHVTTSRPEQAAAKAGAEPLALATVPCRAARLQRVRFRSLPLSLLRECTACVWWRPPGHYDAYPVCCVQVQAPGATIGCLSGADATASFSGALADTGASWAVTPGTEGEAELLLDLTSLQPLPPPPPPAPLPYIDLPPPPPATAWGQPAAAGANGSESGGPVLTGDVKLQLFRGLMQDLEPHIFKGRATQLGAWLSTAFLDPGAQHVELAGRRQLDKVAKPLRRWRGAARIAVVVEYEAAPEL